MVDILTADGFRTHISEQRYSVLRQPIVDLKSGNIHHYEWLVRFDHDGETEGVLRPAELSGVIRDLDLSMLAQAILVNSPSVFSSANCASSLASATEPGRKPSPKEKVNRSHCPPLAPSTGNFRSITCQLNSHLNKVANNIDSFPLTAMSSPHLREQCSTLEISSKLTSRQDDEPIGAQPNPS